MENFLYKGRILFTYSKKKNSHLRGYVWQNLRQAVASHMQHWISLVGKYTKVLDGKYIGNLLHVSYSASRKKNYILKLHLDTELFNRMWLLDAHPLSPNDSYCCIKILSFLLTKKSVSVKLNMASIDRVPLLKRLENIFLFICFLSVTMWPEVSLRK